MKIDIKMDDKALNILRRCDPILERIIATIPEPILESTNDVFFDLMSCVLEQQIHYRSTKRIFQKMLATANLTTLTLENFPAFEQKALSNAKLSMGKLETILAVVTFFQENKINWTLLSDGEVAAKLSSIKGIGNWTIDMILLYTLARPNICPYDDFHLKAIMVKTVRIRPKLKAKSPNGGYFERLGRA